MITCTLSDKQLRSLRVKVAGDLLDLIKPENTDTFDLKNYLKSIYDVVNNNTGNQNSAIDYARMAGVFIKQVYGRDQRLTALRKKGFVFDQVDDFTIGAADDKTGFDYVANLLEVNTNPAVDLAEVKDQLNIAEQIQQVQNQIVRRNSNTVYGVTRKPASAITTSIQELLGGKEENGTDPRLVFYTKFTKNILNLAGQSGKADLAGIPYEGVTDGLFVTLMRYTEIPIEQTYPHVEEVLRSGVEKDFIIEDYNNAFVYVITDKNGNMIQFDEENKVSDSGRIVYYNARYLPNKDKNNKFDVDNVTNTQTPSEIAKSHGISEDEARENLRKEFELLESSYKYIRGNRGNRIIYSIMGGSYGVTPTVLKPVAFSAVNFDKANITYKFFKKGAISSTSNAGVYAIDGKTGSHYLMINDVISEETIDNLITILTEDVVNEEGNKLSPELKKKILSTYIISDVKNVSYGVDKSTGAFFFNIEGQKVKFSDKAKAKADLKEALQKMDGFPRRYILNTDKANNNENVTLFSIKSGAKPVVSTSTVTYDEYLKEYFKVNTAIDSEGSPITYNPYLKLAPVTTETIKVLAPNVAPKATGSPKVVGTAPKTETVQDIYSQLGSTTQTPNVVISNIKTKSGKYDREANIKEAEAKGRIYSMETASDLSFSNPWAHFNRKGTIKTETTEEAVRNYIDWLTTDKFKDVKPKRREWILNQLKSGELKGKAIQYYVELNEPSHVTALDYLINKYDWGTQAPVEVKTISEPYGVVVAETNPSIEKQREFVKLIQPQIQAQAVKENIGKNANHMFQYGLRWARVELSANPLSIKSYGKDAASRDEEIKKLKEAGQNKTKRFVYAYHTLDQNGNPLPGLSVLDPIIKEIENAIGIDMSNYDAVIGNIYLPGQAISTHRDTTESLSARNYPVVVYTIGAGNAINIYENKENPGKTSFASDSKTSIPTKAGTIYTFGLDGKGRFEMAHDTPKAIKKGDTLEPITLPNGDVIKDYTITLTFRRAADLEPGMATSPTASSKTEEVNKEAEEFKAKTIEEGTKQLVQRRGRSSADNNTLDKFLNNKDFLDRHKNKLDKQTNIEATQEQIRLAKAWYAKSPLSKHIKLNIMFNAINTAVPNGIARWDVNGITLFKGADFSDVYHEAWHGFTQMFLTQEERSNLYSEARKASGKFKAFDGSIVEFSKATDEQLEEYLAEDFREFMLSKGKKVLDKTPVKKNIFQKIFDFLRSLFGNVTYEDGLTNGLNNPKINELYEKLRVGDLNEYTFNQANVQFSKGLNKLNMEAVDKSNPRFLPEVSYETSKLITSTVDALFSEAIDYLNKGANTKTYTTSLIRTPEGRTVAYKYAESALTDSLYNAILDRNDMVEAGQDTTAIDKEIDTLSWTLANFGDPNNLSDPQGVIKYHMENSRLMEFEDRAVEMKDDSKLYQKNEFESRSGNELSQKSLASPNLIYTIRSLSDYGKDKNVKLNSLGYPMLMDFNRAWNRLMNVTEGSQNIYDVYSKLQAASVDYPMIKQFLDKVGAPSNLERTSQELWTEITHIFTMKRIPLVELHADVDQSRIEGSRDIQTVVKITPVRAGGEYRKVGTKWDNLFSIAQPNKFITVTADNSNILNIEAVLDEFPAVDNKNVFRFMEALGMPLEENDTVKKALANTENGVMKAIKDLHRVIQYGIYKYNNGPGANKPIVISQPSQLFAEYKVKTDDWRLNATLSGENKKFTLIQKFQLAWSDDFSDTTVSNAEGENQYEKSLRSTLSNNIDKINSAQTITELTQEGVENPDDLSMNHLAKSRNPFMKTSLMMQALFDKDGNRKVHINEYGDRIESAIELLNMSGSSVTINNVRNIIDESGIASANADRATKILQDFYMLMLYGVSEATRHADKSSTYLYRLVHADPKKKHFINLNTFTDNANPEGDMPLSSGKARFIKTLTYYLASEYERIQKVKDDPIASNATVGKSTYGKEGAEFVIFDKILDEDTKKKLKAFRSRSLAEPVVTAEQFVKQLDKDTKLKSSVEEQIGKYLTDQALEFKLELNKLNFYDNANLYSPVLGSMLNKGEFITSLSEDRKNEIIASMAEAYVANSWIQNYETVVTFYGDPALYNHLKDEFFKRNAGIGATGTIARTDQYMQDYINNRLSNVSYAKTLGLTPKRFGKTMTSAVMGDAITSSVYLDDYLKAAKAQEESRLKALKASKKEIKEGLARIEKLFEAYGEMTEGDGQGWINFDAYRSLLMSINKWSPYQEQLYTRVVNGEDVSVEDLYQFFPVKKMQYWGVLKTEGLPLYGFHKYSLMPLIPNLVKGTNLETLQTKMLQQNIDYALLQSGSKINTITSNGKADKFYADAKSNKDKTLAISDPEYKFTPNEIFLDNFKDQLEVHDHFSGKVTFSTQLRKLIEDGLMENGVPVDWRTEIKDPEARIEAWESLLDNAEGAFARNESDNYKKIIKYEALLNRLVDLKKQQLRNEVGGNLKDLLKFVKKELSRQELADHELAFINEATGDLSYSIELSLSADKIEKMLVAIVQKRLINQKINGEALVQVSGVGFEKANTNMRNATEEEIKKYGTNGLKFYEQKADGSTTAMKIKIAMQGSFKNLLELEDVKQKASDEGLTPLDALNSLIQNDEWLDKGDNRQMVTMLAARIPVQGLNSMEFMEVFEFLPESSGNIVILPAEIVAKSGGDFDIDKMYTLMPNIKKQVIEISKTTLEGLGEQLGRKVSRKEVENAINLRENELPLTDTDLEILDYMDMFAQEETKIGLVKGDNVKAIENDLIKSSVEILSMPSNFVSLITPNGTDIVKPVSKDMAKALRGDTGYVSPTEIFEIGRNLYKHQSNSIGKAVLGIIAVNNTFNTLFARTGLVLDQFQAIADDGVTTTYMRQQLRMPHNTIGGNISLSSLYSNEKLATKISDVINQMINGAVDVAKDAWIFDLQGNKEIIPSLLFMIQAGVPVRQAVYFVSQPIIREYVDRTRLYKSQFALPMGLPDAGMFYRIMARNSIVEEITDTAPLYNKRGRIDKTKLFGFFDAQASNGENKKLFTEDNLKANIDSKKTEYTETDIAVFSHFLEIQEMASKITQLTQSLKFDNDKTTTLFDARAKLAKISELNNGISDKYIQRISEESPIAAFKIQDFILELYSDLFPLRDDSVLNNALESLYVKNGEGVTPIMGIKKGLGMDDEQFQRTFRNDFMHYLFQNEYYKFNPNAKTYSNLNIEVTELESLDAGARVKNNVLYVNKKQIESLFKSGAYSRDSVWKYQFAPVPSYVFDLYDKELGLNLFTKFVYERETIRTFAENSFDNIKDTEDYQNYYKSLDDTADEGVREYKAYESVLRDKALSNLNLHGYLFYGDKAYGRQIMALKAKYPELFNTYSLLNNLETLSRKYGSSTITNLKFSNTMYTADDLNIYSQNILDLINPSVEKVSDPEENARISKLFEKLPIFAMLQSAGDTRSTLSLLRAIPPSLVTPVLEQPFNNYIDGNTSKKSEDINNYLGVFMQQYAKQNPLKNKLKNFVTAIKAEKTPKQKRVINLSAIEEAEDVVLATETDIEGDSNARILTLGGISVNLDAIGVPFQPNSQQLEALAKMVDFVSEQGSTENALDNMYTLMGYAGTGKTSITKIFLEYLRQSGTDTVVTATTHKAKGVLKKAVGKLAPVITIHKALNLKPNIDISKDINLDKMDMVQGDKALAPELLIIDESSFIGKNLFEFIKTNSLREGTKVLFIGDPAQIKPVESETEETQLSKQNSPVFEVVKNYSELTQVERQADGNPLGPILDSLRSNLKSQKEPFAHVSSIANNQGIAFTDSGKQFIGQAVEAFKSDNFKKNRNFARLITYTNSRVEEYNKRIRQGLGFTQDYMPGEILMGYDNWRMRKDGTYSINNSVDYVVVDSEYVQEFSLGGNLLKNIGLPEILVSGYNLTIEDITEPGKTTTVFVLDSNNDESVYEAIANTVDEIARMAKSANDTLIWAKYYYPFKESFGSNKDIRNKKGGLVLKKLLDYGYAHTIHKSQGATYTNIFVDYASTSKSRDTEERNQMRYVALSRATNIAYAFSGEAQGTPPAVDWNSSFSEEKPVAAATSQVKLTKKTEEEIKTLQTIAVMENLKSGIRTFVVAKDKENGTNVPKKGVLTTESAKLFALDYPDALPVYNETVEADSNIAGTNTVWRDSGIGFGIPTKKTARPTAKDKTKLNTAAAMTENTPEELAENKKVIDEAIAQLVGERDKGKNLIFDAMGYGQYMIGYNELTGQKLEGDPIAKETFLYLSQKLFSNFGYVNPHYLDYLEGRREVQKTQPISDDEIIEQNKKCFRRK